MGKMIAGTVVVLIVLVVAFFLTREGPFSSSTSGPASAGLEEFSKVDFASRAAKIVIQKGGGDPVELVKSGETWSVASSWGYEADAEGIQKLLDDLDSLDEGEVIGKSSSSHASFEVDKAKGGFVTVKDASGADLGRLVVGKSDSRSRNFTGKSKVFVRFGDDVETLSVASDIRSNAKLWSEELDGKAFLKKKLVDTKTRIEKGEEKKVETEIFEVRISRPDQADLLAELRREEVPVAKPADEDEPAVGDGETAEESAKEPETETKEYFVVTSGAETLRVGKDKEWSVRSLLNKGETVRIDDVAEPKPLAEYGLDEPQLKVSYKYREKKVADAPVSTVTLRFGNAIKDENGEDKEFYFAVEGIEGKVYKVAKWTKEGWDKKLSDFKPDPKPEPVEDGAGDGSPDDESDGSPDAAGAGSAEAGDAGDGSAEAGEVKEAPGSSSAAEATEAATEAGEGSGDGQSS